jgi:hypothetical protein
VDCSMCHRFAQQAIASPGSLRSISVVQRSSSVSVRRNAGGLDAHFSKANEDHWRPCDCSKKPKSADRGLSAPRGTTGAQQSCNRNDRFRTRSADERPAAQTDHRPGRPAAPKSITTSSRPFPSTSLTFLTPPADPGDAETPRESAAATRRRCRARPA